MSVTINNIMYYCYNYSTATVIISKNLPTNSDVVIPNKISFSATNHNVTDIGRNAFNSCREIKSVVIGDNVTNIGDAVFALCPNLTSVVIGNSVTHLGNLCFYGSSNLSKVVFSNFNALNNVGNLILKNVNADCIVEIYGVENELYLNSDAKKIYDILKNEKNIKIEFINRGYIFNSNNNIKNNEKPLVENPIQNQKLLVENPIQNHVQEITIINDKSFIKNNVIYFIKENHISVIGTHEPPSDWYVAIPQNIAISENVYTVTTIEKDAFKNLPELKSITIPNTVTYIGKSAFEGCINLKHQNDALLIPDSVTEIAEDAFHNCVNLKSVYLGARLQTLGDRCFNNVPFNSIYFMSPCTIQNIGRNIFSKNNSLQPLNITYYMVNDVNRLNQNIRVMHSQYFGNANVIQCDNNK